MRDFVGIIKALMKAESVTEAEISAALGVTPGFVNHILHRRKACPEHHIPEMCKCLGMSKIGQITAMQKIAAFERMNQTAQRGASEMCRRCRRDSHEAAIRKIDEELRL